MSSENTIKPRTSLWITLEADEIIELRRIRMDSDAAGAVDFFWNVLTPRVVSVARQRRIALDLVEAIEGHEHLSG